MPDIYLHVEGQQTGPYQLAQLRQFLAEGRISAETPAWYEGLAAWSTVSAILTAFPPAGGPPSYPPPPPPPAPAKQGMHGCLLAAIIVGCFFVGLFVLSCLAGIALGPITNGILKAKENMSMQQARAIEIAMFSYANDNNGAYPDGKTSTEVFQKLIDGKYISDPGIFYVAMPGKTKATSNTLTADNVCYDVTSGVTANSPDDLPLVFSTGYDVTYSAGASATQDRALTAFPGIDVAYKSNSASFIQAGPDRAVRNFIPANFDPGNKTYRQLRP